MGFADRRHTVAVARAVAGQNLTKLVPVDRADFILPGVFVERQIVVGDFQVQVIGLAYRGIDEALTQIVIGKPLDLPGGGLVRMG